VSRHFRTVEDVSAPFGGAGPAWGGGEKLFYTAEGGEIVLVHEGELELEQRSDEHMPGEIPLGGGVNLRINPEYFRMIMHTPEITAMVDQRCEEITQEANSLAIKDGAEYVYQVSNNTENIRARGRVKPGNEAAKIDDDENATLLHALATVGSDPLPPQYFPDNDAYQRYLSEHNEFYSGPDVEEAPPPAPEGTEGGEYFGGDEGGYFGGSE
jgi:hypothetical protein